MLGPDPLSHRRGVHGAVVGEQHAVEQYIRARGQPNSAHSGVRLWKKNGQREHLNTGTL